MKPSESMKEDRRVQVQVVEEIDLDGAQIGFRSPLVRVPHAAPDFEEKA